MHCERYTLHYALKGVFMNIFSYESKISQLLMFIADLALLNICFILCCIPLFTIGAAQAALYTGIRTLVDKESDENPLRMFFKSFITGFKDITLGWGVGILGVVVLAVVTVMVGILAQTQKGAPVWMSIIALALLTLWTTQMPMFHSRFACTPKQLWRNSTILLIMHPLRSILVTVLMWLPVGVLAWDTFTFLAGTPGWVLLYYSMAFLANFYIMKKPFEQFIRENTPQEELTIDN